MNEMKIKRHQQGGVIIEILVASVIFATAMLALVEFQTNLLGSRVLVNQETEALSYTQDKMQYFRNYTALTNATTGIAYSDITNNSTTISASTATYNMTWSVTNNTSPTNKAVTISTQWTDPSGVSHTVSITSIIASIDPKGTGKVSEILP
jgi:Tfp pilus assembly protein PilV